MNIKECLYNKCQVFINDRLHTIQHTIGEIQNALLSETKSSAGDKHETGRAMLQLEREKAGHQLAEIQKVKEVLAKINLGGASKTIRLGSIVYTSQANYFIAISAGEIRVDNTSYFAISPKTPIGQLLVSKKIGDVVVFRENNITIQTVL